MRRGRPTIGGTPREKRVTVRLTAQEEEALTRLHGSPGKGIRYLVAAMMRAEGKKPPHPPKKTRASSSDASPVSDASASPGGERKVDLDRAREQGISEEGIERIKEAQEAVTAGEVAPSDIERKTSNARAEALRAVAAGTHRHKPEGEPIRVEYAQGVEKKVYACVCGKEMKR